MIEMCAVMNTVNTHEKGDILLCAFDCQELISKLSTIDISVPARTEGRTTEHTERYCMCRLLSTLAESDYLTYPVRVIKREKPDFSISSSGRAIGIEVTEATSKDYSAYLALHEREAPDDHLIEPGLFYHGKITTLEEKRKYISKSCLSADGWVGDSIERDCLLYIKDAISAKCNKLAEYDTFDENWLLIYENTPRVCT